MSYCVNCGVELDESAKKCPLCGTPVLNPYAPPKEKNAVSPYSQKLYIPSSNNKRYIALMITIVLLIPNIIFLIANLIFPEIGNWALYVNSTSLIVFILFISPFLYKKVYPYLLIVLDAISILLYIYFFYAVFQEKEWFFRIAVPIVLGLGVFISIFYAWCSKKKRDWPYIVIYLLTIMGIYSIFTDMSFNSYYKTGHVIKYSIIIVVSCICLILFFLFIAKNKKFRSWLQKRMFV